MILVQRRKHLYTWTVLSILLPLLYLLSWLVIPEDKIEVPPEVSVQISIEHAVDNGRDLLEIHVQKPTAAPGSLVLLGEKNTITPETAIIIGQVQGMGSYKFELPDLKFTPEPYLLIYNPFNKMVTHQFPL